MRTRNTAILAASLLSLALAACHKDADDQASTATPATDEYAEAPADTTPDTTTEPAATPASYTIDRFTVGGTGKDAYLADSQGRRLYVLDKDQPGVTCIGDCVKTWHPVVGPAPATVDIPDVSAASLGTVTLADGTTQVTYYGHPLYYYDDGTPTLPDVTVTAESPYGKWYLVNAAGETVALQEGVPTTDSPTAAGADARDLPTQNPGDDKPMGGQ